MAEGDSEYNNLKRKLVVPTKPEFGDEIEPEVRSMLQDSLAIIRYQIAQMKQKVNPLNAAEARALNGLVKSLLDISRELRERDKADPLDKLTDEELKAKLKDKGIDVEELDSLKPERMALNNEQIKNTEEPE